MTDHDGRIVEGSGNVFADLGLPDADELLLHAELTHLIHAALRERKATPEQAAELLRVAESEAAQLLQGRLLSVPTERLLHFLMALGRDVDIVVRPQRGDAPAATLRVLSSA